MVYVCHQVLDDSTCKVTRQLVDEKAAEWAERGVRCEVIRRTNRQGYKAGALKDVRALCLPQVSCHNKIACQLQVAVPRLASCLPIGSKPPAKFAEMSQYVFIAVSYTDIWLCSCMQ